MEIEILSRKLDRFGWDRLDPAVKDRLTADWVQCLSRYHLAEIRKAIGECLTENPKHCPHEHQVKAKIEQYRAKVAAALPKPQPEHQTADRGTPEQRAAIDEIVKRRFPSNR